MSIAEQVIEAVATGVMTPQVRSSIRAYPVIVDGKQRRVVTCADCGDQFAVSSRTVRLAQQQNRLLLCTPCRRPARVKITLVHTTYWTSIMTPAQIVELAEQIWGPREAW